jgi:hypothetical protein
MLNENGSDTDVTDMNEMIIKEIRGLRKEQSERDERQLKRDAELDRRIEELEDALKKRLKNVEKTLDLVLAQQQTHGTSLEEMKGQCRKRLEVCRGGNDSRDSKSSASGDSWPAEEAL